MNKQSILFVRLELFDLSLPSFFFSNFRNIHEEIRQKNLTIIQMEISIE